MCPRKAADLKKWTQVRLRDWVIPLVDEEIAKHPLRFHNRTDVVHEALTVYFERKLERQRQNRLTRA